EKARKRRTVLPTDNEDGRSRQALGIVSPQSFAQRRKLMPQESSHRQDSGSLPEDLFTLLFSQMFGLEKASLLVPQYPVTDIDGKSRFVDFALQTTDGKVALEIDGLTFHHPAAVTVADYEDQLLRQNSLIHLGWRVFRWTDRQITQEPEQVQEQLA